MCNMSQDSDNVRAKYNSCGTQMAEMEGSLHTTVMSFWLLLLQLAVWTRSGSHLA